MGSSVNPKAEALRLIESLPEDATLEEIQYHLYVMEKARRGVQAIARGEVVTHEEVKAEVAQWHQASSTSALLTELAGTLRDEDARQMLEAIEEGCDRNCSAARPATADEQSSPLTRWMVDDLALVKRKSRGRSSI